MAEPEGGPRRRRLLVALSAAWILLAVDILEPVDTTLTRAGVIVLLATCWALGVLLARKRARRILLLAPLAVLLLALPARAPRMGELRDRYVAAMQDYAGAPYVWGGEGRYGIDCSGLVRRGLVDALVRQGLRRGDPGCLRRAIALWWHDMSAKSLGEGASGWTVPVTQAARLSELDLALLKPGDLAITRDGVHVLACTRPGAWIEADPEEGVITITASESSPWTAVPIQVVRWNVLASP